LPGEFQEIAAQLIVHTIHGGFAKLGCQLSIKRGALWREQSRKVEHQIPHRMLRPLIRANTPLPDQLRGPPQNDAECGDTATLCASLNRDQLTPIFNRKPHGREG
jgi:hypothetical protein